MTTTLVRGTMLVLLLTTGTSWAQSAADQVTETTTQALETRQGSQAQLDEWAAERAALKNRWDVARAQVAYLEQRAALERDRVLALEASLEDTLLVILGRLEDAVAADLPFLAAERDQRLISVRSELSDPGATASDKLRRVLEALLIEARYGGTFEVYQDRIEVAGEELTGDLLHVGRLGLFWLTPDQVRGGVWDPGTGAFVELEGGELDAIRRAGEMATRRRPVGVLGLPLGRTAR